MTEVWWRKRKAARVKARVWLVGAVLVYLLCVSLCLSLRTRSSNHVVPFGDGGKGDAVVTADVGVKTKSEVKLQERFRRDTGVSVTNHSDTGLTADDNNKTCTPRAINNFPANFLTLEETQDGGVVVHILIALYLFAALAIVCDDYFVPALERICEDLGLQEDVAGATFMAAGSSAPELCTSVVGVFIAQSDVGVGTIVGSAVFNILAIVGLCGLCAGMIVHLTWYPLVRDTLFYLLSVLTLVLVIQDSLVYWYEGLAMLLLYGVYIVLMYFNRRLENRAIGAVDALKARWRGHGAPKDHGEKETLLGDSGTHKKVAAVGSGVVPTTSEEAETGFGSSGGGDKNNETEDKKYESPWEIPDSFIGRVYWVATIPVRALCYFTVPDCRRGGVWRKLYPLTFLTSVVWIAGFTYVMVWMITIAGDALSIPDTVMGLTLLAAGTSLPDCLASILVSRDGYGDMAVSNSIGSNVFDILLCLGLPWLIETAALKKGDEALEISSSGLLYSSLTLLATVVFLLISISINRWRLTKGYGVVCMVAYVVVITLSSLYELNVFADLNPPACPR